MQRGYTFSEYWPRVSFAHDFSYVQKVKHIFSEQGQEEPVMVLDHR